MFKLYTVVKEILITFRPKRITVFFFLTMIQYRLEHFSIMDYETGMDAVIRIFRDKNNDRVLCTKTIKLNIENIISIK